MADIPLVLLPHTVTVETLTGQGAYGPIYDDAADVRVKVDDRIRLVRNLEGEQVVSSATVYARLSESHRFTPGSRVVIRGELTDVITVARHDDGGLGAWQHVEVVCE